MADSRGCRGGFVGAHQHAGEQPVLRVGADGGCKVAGEIEVESKTLVDLVAGRSWQPDIIKIDTESFEYEIICPSLSLFERLKPALQLEVHWEMLAARDRAAADFLAPLADMGYRGIQRRYRNYDAWQRASRSQAVSRMALEPS